MQTEVLQIAPSFLRFGLRALQRNLKLARNANTVRTVKAKAVDRSDANHSRTHHILVLATVFCIPDCSC
jgi:hypothetical protein